MEPQEQLTPAQFIADRLNDAIRKAETGKSAEALAAIKEAKAADTKNIYLIAFEKQVFKLGDEGVTPENKSEILRSLPAMTERAVADCQRRVAVKPAEAQAQQAIRDKEAALDKLKTQYFHRADDYIAKGDYAHALEEVRRIYIIDPNNVVAKEYEQKVQQLSMLKPDAQQEGLSAGRVEAQPPPMEEEEETSSKMPMLIGALVVVAAIVGFLVLSKKSSEGTDIAKQGTEESIPNLPTESVVTPESGNKPEPEVQEPAPRQPEPTPPTPQRNQRTQSPEPQRPAQTQPQRETPRSQPPVNPAPQQQPAQQQPVQQVPTQQPVQQLPAPSQPPPSQPAQQPVQREAVPRPFIAIEANPELVKLARPQYPEIALRTGVEGKVVVEVMIDPEGKPMQATVIKSSSMLFNSAAIDAAMKSTYKPAMMSNGPMAGKITIPINFQLRR